MQPDLRPLIISAPFGNYIQPDGATATLGTFTAQPRPGRIWRIVKTVRYYPSIGAWKNKIGLRNPGIADLVDRVRTGKVNAADKLVSIHGFTEAEWFELLEWMADIKPGGIELNMSCPNVGGIDWPAELFARAMETGVPVVVKMPPVNYRLLFDQSAEAGVRAYHCCNTLPVPSGGVSGKPLMPVALQCIRDVLENLAGAARDELIIIGGGGITKAPDIDAFADAGATRFAVGTKVMNPRYLWSTAALHPLMQRAGQIVEASS